VISPSVCLNQTSRCKFEELLFLDVFAEAKHLGIMENHYNRLVTMNWSDRLSDEKINDTYAFWSHVFEFKSAGGVFVFRELATFILTLLSLPTSNAVVERMFSVMNSVKNKVKNRMQLQLLSSILRIKAHFFAISICCQKFKPSQDMIKDFNSKITYPKKTDSRSNDSEDSDEIIEIIDSTTEFQLPCISIVDFN